MTDVVVRPPATALHLPVLRSAQIAAVPGVVHGITGRRAGLGRADGNVGYSAPRDRVDAWAMRQAWAQAAGIDAEQIVCVYQTHGRDVYVASRADAGSGARPEVPLPAEADAIVVGEPGVVAMTLHADCMPILLCDPQGPVVAAVHAGWRSTVLDVAGETVRTMARHFGSDPSRIVAYLGPAIGRCCYEVGGDVAKGWRDATGAAGSVAIEPRGDRWLFDLESANRLLLGQAGVLECNLGVAGICTRCEGERWFSHRGQGPHTGRFGAMIGIQE
jgi:polyphenol oxidase